MIFNKHQETLLLSAFNKKRPEILIVKKSYGFIACKDLYNLLICDSDNELSGFQNYSPYTAKELSSLLRLETQLIKRKLFFDLESM